MVPRLRYALGLPVTRGQSDPRVRPAPCLRPHLTAPARTRPRRARSRCTTLIRASGGWKRGPEALDDVAKSTGAADLHRERADRHQRDRETW